MPKSPAPAATTDRKRRAAAFTTMTIVSFSLTLLGGAIAVLTGLVPLQMLTRVERIDLGAVLFVAPILALVLAVVFEATRIALTRKELPQPRRREAVANWTPGRGEG